MKSNAYMKPESQKGKSIFRAYGVSGGESDFNIEAQRIISDIYWYFKEEDRGISFTELVEKSIHDADNWVEEE